MVLATASALAGCSASPAPAQTPRSGPSTNTAPQATQSTYPTDRSTRQRGRANISSSAPRGASNRPDGTTADRVPNRTEGTTAPRTATAIASSPSCVNDPASDLESAGNPPAYSDIRSACIRDARRSVRLELTVAGEVPARMPDRDTSMTIGFELRHDSGSESYAYAEANQNGWTAYITRGRGKRALPQAVAINGQTIAIIVARSKLDDAKRLRWNVESSWLKAELIRTSYAFDTAPDRGHSSFGGV